ncbi:MAG: tRNA pseudouridine(55) synthase TruB [Lachnospiraceae bacterium]|nr:tRNA pseudouridine(55) synthase TruB [Lachnospiraceae bacterium]
MADRYNGLLNVYKEAGWTSNDVVAKLRGILKQKKIGHTGTLDPDAVGVLVVCLGSATSLTDMLTDHDKEYLAVCKLGVTTDTQDLSGTVTEELPVHVTPEEVRRVVRAFQGDYEQIPPMYSAIKVNGRRLYTLARNGVEIERKPRTVKIHAISVADTSALETDHTFVMEVRCSRGTYIRTLCHDIGQALGTGGAMAHLTRCAVADFRIENARTIGEIQALSDAGHPEEAILPVDRVFRDLDKIVFAGEARKAAVNGNALRLNQLISFAPDREQDPMEAETLYKNEERVRLYDENGVFFGVYRYDAKRRVFQPEKFLYRADA